ncbi:bacteriocin-protection, YdeI/OmpD-Associated family protein [[Clostridium] bifermentans ATCC 638]|uniref:Bacteriocin-protection, YdeI/OmpD-Associated family protein n=1 Tax=Paraclostridium bifermentans ATCC 638 = DSM 14991 TaxID=1233171 RepID=T4VA16_PARBF|nr:YdeI/OmpD-associated family protein [Paraclostridium bifermentans]EQK40549.1 bacteriocin-protection, YdeI/OmpD-Associated family protein [[Clostridium] bifermentans ATCC 638] [Paraclostridium bifermentans ATCC 638 = DSM 14991]RIZ58733.1 thymidylate synthase [Paraclostridium bifermentans]UAG18173.1 YdeI/OmpD-associated family protein [Paraclostridium bifermentans]
MELNNLLNVKNREELRAWLNKNHKIEKECWVIVNRGKAKINGEFIYLDLVEEAMCFGWIDSTCKKIEEGITAQRISPRRKNSSWTELNKERCRRLEKIGLLTESGRSILPDISMKSFDIDEDVINSIKEDSIAWDNFNKLPELYKRIRIDNIQSYKKQREVYDRRLKKFIDKTRDGVMYGDWNDNGRLLDY